MRSTWMLLGLLGVGGVALAEDAPAPTTPPASTKPIEKARTPAEAAAAVVAAVDARDEATLRVLAATDDPDPWIVADELVRAGKQGAAEAFASAAPRADVEALPKYVSSRPSAPDDAPRRARLAAALAALGRHDARAALDALGEPGTPTSEDVVGVRSSMVRGGALQGLHRLDEAHEAFRAAAALAERVGWIARAALAYDGAGLAAARAGSFPAARDAWLRQIAICERRADRTGAAAALSNLGNTYYAEGDLAKALETYTRALAALESLGATEAAATALSNIGNVHFGRGDFVQALATYERALTVQEALGDQVGAARTLGNVGIVHYMLGDYDKALSTHQRALEAKERLHDEDGMALTLGNVGNVQRKVGDSAKALASYQRAMEILESHGDRATAATMMANTGIVWADLGEHALALSMYERALAAQVGLGDKLGAAATRSNIGIEQYRVGDFAKAISTLERALAEQQRLGDKAGAAKTTCTLAVVRAGLGDLATAQALADRALAAQEALGDRAGAAVTLGDIGNVRRAMGDHAGALEAYERAMAVQRALGDKAGAALTLANIGGLQITLGDRTAALSSLERALAAQQALGDRFGAASTTGSIGTLQFEMGDPSKAFATYERALAMMEALGDRAGAAEALGAMGQVHLARGDVVQAMAAARASIQRRTLVVQGLGAAEGAGAREPAATVYDTGARAALAANDVTAFGFFLESGRAGALVEGLQSRTTLWETAVPPALRTAEARARAEQASASSALRRAEAAGDRAALRARRTALDAADEALANVIARIQRDAKAGASVTFPEVATLDEIRASLVDGDVLVLYTIFDGEGSGPGGGKGEEPARALVLTSGGARVATLPTARAIDAQVAAIALDDKTTDPGAALAELARLVIQPLELGPATKRVLVSPDGALAAVPFAALLPGVTVAYVASGTTYRVLRGDERLRGEGVLALGDPDYDKQRTEAPLLVANRGGLGRLPRLPATRDEASAVGTVTLLGADATEAGLAAALGTRPRWRAVHLACHGLLNAERPALSSLALTPAGDDDGFLSCLDVFRMKVSADLVVLSACETGRGKLVKSEGLVGLARAFMFAGAPRVLGSLWKVDDDATRALMTRFYELWNPADGKPGLPTAEALRRAQGLVRDDPSHPQWRHPYYWAAWVLWGLPS